MGGDVGDVDPEPGRSPLAPSRDCVVEVTRGGRIDGEGRHLDQIAARRRGTRGRLGGPPRLALEGRSEPAAPFELFTKQDLDRLARRPRIGAAAPSGAARAHLASRCSAASTSRALSRPSSREVSGSSEALTSGWIPLPARLVPSGVKYSPIVSFIAPPFERSTSCWKTPLPNERVPTTSAPA